MIWYVLIGFGVFCLCAVGGMGGWLLIAIGIAGLSWKLMHKNMDDNYESSSDIVSDNKIIEIPDDAYAAVEAFARFTNSTYRMIQQMSPGRDKYFYQIIISLQYGSDDASSKAEFSFDFDYNMESFHESFGYELGSGFSVDGDYVYYRSQSIRNLYSWVGAATLQQRESGLHFDKYLAAECANGIVATVENNCPDAYVSSKSASENGFHLIFKFR